MLHYEPYAGPDRRARDRSLGVLLRRRQQQKVEVERRREAGGASEIAAALEMHLDQCRTRGAMLKLLGGWLAETRDAPPQSQDAEYARAVERAIAVMKQAPDAESGIAMLQRR